MAAFARKRPNGIDDALFAMRRRAVAQHVENLGEEEEEEEEEGEGEDAMGRKGGSGKGREGVPRT